MMRSITGRLTVWFLLIALIPCAVLTLLLYIITRESTRELVLKNLRSISEGKASILENYAVERLRSAVAFSRVPRIIEACTILEKERLAKNFNKEEFKPTYARYQELMKRLGDSFEYPNMYLFSPTDEVLLALHDDLPLGSNIQKGNLGNTELAKVIGRARTLVQTEISDYAKYKETEEPAAFVATPILNETGGVLGVLVIQLNNRSVFSVLQDFSGLGSTGETLVGSLINEEIVIVSPLRKEKNAAFSKRIPLSEDARGMALKRAVQGEHGQIEGIDYHGDSTFAVYTYLPYFRWGMVVKQDTQEVFEALALQRQRVLIALIVTAVMVVCTAVFVARSISRPIIEAAQLAEKVAAGDLTSRVMSRAHGETRQLFGALQQMMDYLRSLIGKIQGSSVTLMSTATQIAATSRQQEQAMTEYRSSTNQAAAAVKEISATSQELLRTMDAVSSVAGETATMAASGQHGLADMEKTMRQLVDSTGSINAKLSVISERAREINVVVSTITRVADQTNLLSINAAIEAEKAGEAGLGFLVVAREIRRLADQTAASTLNIERIVKDMQQSVTAGVMEMDKFSEQVRRSVEEVGQIGGGLGKIIVGVQSLSGRFDQVNEGMRAQAQGADQIRDAMVRLSDGANQTLRSLSEFNKATEQLREAVGSLKEDVSRFTIASSSPNGKG